MRNLLTLLAYCIVLVQNATAQVTIPDTTLKDLQCFLNFECIKKIAKVIDEQQGYKVNYGSVQIDLKPDFDDQKSSSIDVTIPEGWYFCGYKVTVTSEHWSELNVGGLKPKGFSIYARAKSSTNIFNQERGWLEARVSYRMFQLTRADAIPNCTSDGYSVTDMRTKTALPGPTAKCEAGTMICTPPSGVSTPCGPCGK